MYTDAQLSVTMANITILTIIDQKLVDEFEAMLFYLLVKSKKVNHSLDIKEDIPSMIEKFKINRPANATCVSI